MEQVHVVIAVAGTVVIGLGLLSDAIKRSPVSVPLLACLAGIVAGPVALGWIDWDGWADPHLVLKEAARFTLGISVAGIALRTPARDLRRLLRPVGLLLTAGMGLMWGVSTGLASGLLGLPLLAAALLGAILSPTDPVVASSIVNGKPAEEALPDRLRSTLSLESGANDGLGYLIVMLPLLGLTSGMGADTWAEWLREVLLVSVLLAILAGAALGALAGRALRAADARGLVAEHSLLSLSIALSLLALSAAKLIGSDGILAAFGAGAAFNLSVDREEQMSEENVQEAILKLFNLPVFVLFGAMLPWAGWVALGSAAVVFAFLVLALRRPVTLAALGPALGACLLRRDAVFLGWFAPVGVAAIYYALHARHETGDDLYWHAASLVVAASVLAHGVTAAAGMRLYDRAAAG